MKINIECVLKYLKHDYKEEGEVIAAILGLTAICAAIWFVPSVIWPYISSYYTAYNLLNIVAGIIVVVFTMGIAVFGNKESFLVKETSELDTKDVGTSFFITIAFLSAIFPYLLYCIGYLCNSVKWESPILSIIVFITLILIGTPIGCAIARCKKE